MSYVQKLKKFQIFLTSATIWLAGRIAPPSNIFNHLTISHFERH